MNYLPFSGMFTWRKGENVQLSPNFMTSEFECPGSRHGAHQEISADLIYRLELYRQITARPVKVNSGYRSPEYQEELRQRGYQTAKKKSQHELGMAADIVVTSAKDFKVLETLFKAIGKGKGWAHIDLRADRKRRWGYDKTTNTTSG